MAEPTSHDHFSLAGFFRKRRTSILLGFVSSFLLCLLAISMLPSVYKAYASILVEGRLAPQDMLKATMAGYVQEHITSVTETILTRENLLRINDQFAPYPQMAGSSTQDEILEQLRKDISIDAPKASLEDQALGRAPTATYTLLISYQSRNPATAAQVAIVLMNMFIDESSHRRASNAKDTFLFLDNQYKTVEREIADVEQAIATFKKKNLRSLPELMSMNLMTMERTQKAIDNTRMEINLAKERKVYLEGQVAMQKPMRDVIGSAGAKVMTAEEQLRQLRNDYLAAKATRSAQHPDVIRMSRQIEALEDLMKDKDRARISLQQLKERQAALADLRKRYTPQHPDVVAMEKEVASLAGAIADAAHKNAEGASSDADTPDNPAYITLMTQLTQVNLEIEAKQAMLGELEYEYGANRKRIEDTPGVEQDFTALQDRYTSLKEKRADLYTRLQNAKEATQIEQHDVGEKLTVLESPQIPEKPFKPKRMLLGFLGFLVSIGLGFITGFAVESVDPTVHSPQEASVFTGLPLLGVLPSLETTQERARLLRRRRVMILAGLGSLGVGLLAWLLWSPLSTFFSGLFPKS